MTVVGIPLPLFLQMRTLSSGTQTQRFSRAGIWTSLSCCLDGYFLFSNCASQTLCHEYFFIIWKTHNFLNSELGPRGPWKFCVLSHDSLRYGSLFLPWVLLPFPLLWVLLQFPFPFPYSVQCTSWNHLARWGREALDAWQSHSRAGLVYSLSFFCLSLFLLSCLPLAFLASPENKPGSQFWFN